MSLTRRAGPCQHGRNFRSEGEKNADTLVPVLRGLRRTGAHSALDGVCTAHADPRLSRYPGQRRDLGVRRPRRTGEGHQPELWRPLPEQRVSHVLEPGRCARPAGPCWPPGCRRRPRSGRPGRRCRPGGSCRPGRPCRSVGSPGSDWSNWFRWFHWSRRFRWSRWSRRFRWSSRFHWSRWSRRFRWSRWSGRSCWSCWLDRSAGSGRPPGQCRYGRSPGSHRSDGS